MRAARSRVAGAAPLVLALLLVHSSAAQATPSAFLDEAHAITDWIVEARRDLHRIPERLFALNKTAAYVRRKLDDLGIPYNHSIAETGIIAEIGSGAPVVILRADMDALPIEEKTGFDFASEHPGMMHACGHDGHTAILLGAARILAERLAAGSLPAGTVRLAFQPAEEGGAGALRMVEAGLAEGAAGAFGLHVWPTHASGVVATRRGTIMGGASEFDIVVEGAGAHAAMPHKGSDPVVAASHVVVALQSLVSREVDPLEAAVVSITRFVAGDGERQAHNVIPNHVLVGGTMRGNSAATIARLRRRIEALVAATAAAHETTATVDWLESKLTPYPPLVNDDDLVALARSVATELFGDAGLAEEPGTMAGEDFAFIAERVPSAFVFLGNHNESAGTVHGLHTDGYSVDETVLPRGAALHAAVADAFLRRHASREAPASGEPEGEASREEL